VTRTPFVSLVEVAPSLARARRSSMRDAGKHTEKGSFVVSKYYHWL
jgi:hypothetical protein